MDSSSSFRPVSISDEKDLSIPFLVDWILAVILCILTPFYLGRVFAWVLTKGLDIWVWRQYKVKITLQSLKISFLGGRIFFKNLTIVTNDATISFLEGSFTWRYWLLHTRIRGIDFEKKDIDAKENAKLPSRFLLQCDGLEVFVYNRIEVYESVLKEYFANGTDDNQETESNDDKTINTENDATNSKSSKYSTASSAGRSENKDSCKLSAKTKLFPIQLKANRGAIVLGNRNTKNVGVFKFEQGNGVCDICSSPSKFDVYRRKICTEFSDVVFELRTNLGYQNDNPIKTFVVEKTMDKVYQTIKKRFVSIINIFLPDQDTFKNTQQAYMESWNGLDLYQHNQREQDDNIDRLGLHELEYARYSRVMKSEKISVVYYFDIPGVVPSKDSYVHSQGEEGQNSTIDYDDLPSFGVDVHICKAAIYYGPWAHKHMQDIIRLFSPIVCRDQINKTTSEAGSLRKYKSFKLSVDFCDKSILHIPTRESSKDEEFIKRYKSTGDTQRAFGWLKISLNEGSEMLFSLALYPENDWLANELFVKLLTPEIKSSVNHELLFRAETHTIKANIGYPSGWNKQTDWLFELESKNAELFLLRDHIFLISDLFTDFSADGSIAYDLFRPFTYKINWDFTKYKLYLNVNDANIIDNPLDFNENCFLLLSGDLLNTSIDLPLTSIAKASHETKFVLKSPLVNLSIHPPCWNTLHEFLTEKTFGECPNFLMSGSYTSHSSVDVDNTDTIILDFQSSATKFLSFGFVLRYLMNIKLNYFGDFDHFKTTEEYSNELSNNEKASKSVPPHQSLDEVTSFVSTSTDDSDQSADSIHIDRIQKSSVLRTKNETDVWVTFFVDDGCIIVPANLYDCENSFLLSFSRMEFDMRYTNYYMDLTAAFSRIYIDHDRSFTFGRIIEIDHTVFHHAGCLDDLNLHGHRMFGVPPVEETYICKWDISLHSLRTDSEIGSLITLQEAIQKVGFTYKDEENILIYSIHKPEDITSLTISIDKVSVLVKNDTIGSARLSLENISVNSWDLCNLSYSKRLDVNVTGISFSILNLENGKLLTCDTSLDFTNFVVPSGLKKHRTLQEKCVLLNDSPFHRCKFLLALDHLNDNALYEDLYRSVTPSISLPTLSVPLTFQTFDSIYERLLGSYVNIASFDIDNVDTKTLIDNKRFTGVSYPLPKTVMGNKSGQFSDDTEHVNMIFSVPLVSLFVTPEALTFIKSIVESTLEASAESVMDDIEMNIVGLFFERHVSMSTTINLSVILKDFDFCLSDKPLSYHEPLQMSNRIHFSLSDVSIISKTLKLPKSGIDFETKYAQESTISCSFDSLTLKIFKASTNCLAKVLPVARCDIQTSDGIFFSSVGEVLKFHICSVNVSIIDDDMEWVARYLFGLTETLMKDGRPIIDLSDLKKAQTKNTFFNVAQTGQHCGIDTVPYIITKPAYITRLSKYHVRDSASWKIITRLRHVLKNSPSFSADSTQNTNAQVKTADFLQQKTQFLDLFSNWKNWDAYEVEQSTFFDVLFNTPIFSPEEGSLSEVSVFVETFEVELLQAPQQTSISLKQIDLTMKKLTRDAILDFDTMGYDKEELDINLLISSADISVSNHFIKRCILLPKSFPFPTSTLQKTTHDWISKIRQNYLSVSRLSLALHAKKYTAIVASHGFSVAVLETTSDLNLLSSVKYSLEMAALTIRYLDRTIFKIKLKDILGSFLKTAVEHIIFTDSSIDSITMNSSDMHLGELVKHFRLLEHLFEEIKDSCINHDSSTESVQFNHVCILSMKVSSFNLRTSAFNPFIVRTTINGLEVSLKINSGSLTAVTYSEFLLDFCFNQSKILRISNSFTKLNCKNSTALTELGVDTDTLKITLSDTRFCVEEIVKNLVDKKVEISNILGDKNGIDRQVSVTSKPLIIKLNSVYVGLLTELKSTNFVLEFNQTAFTYQTKPGAIDEQQSNSSHQEFSLTVQNLCILIISQDILSSQSKILDIGVVLKLIEEGSKKTLQIENPHSRVSLTPFTLVSVIYLVQEAKSTLKRINQRKKVESSSAPLKIPSYFEDLSVNILSNKLCIGWIFDEDASENGIIIGYESLFAAYEKPYGKLTIVDGYVALAQGKESDNFFISNGVPEFNRSHLSSMQMNFWFSNKPIGKDLFVRMNANKLDVKILTSLIEITNALASSIESFQKKLTKVRAAKKTNISSYNVAENLSEKLVIPSIRSVNCIVKYGGGIVKLYTPEDIAGAASKSSLELRSPSIKVTLDYLHNSPSEKQHWIRSSVNVESTHNILFSSCVPVLIDLTSEIRKQMESFNADRKPSFLNKVREEPSNTQSTPFDYNNMFKNFDIATIINVGAQNITLTCEPKAKIQAELGFRNFKISMFTNSLEHTEPLSLSLKWSEIEINTRHIFSRKISSSAGINEIYLDLLITNDNTIKTYGNTLISDLKFYINMKQLQEITLFLDIWSPKAKKSAKPKHEHKPTQKIKSQSLADFTAPKIPWSYQIVFKNTTAIIDMDPSLGSINFKAPKFWLSFHHRADWSHSVSFYLDELKSKSDGRLGGLLEIENVFFDSSITWPVKNHRFEAPLINLIFKMENLSLKLGFDYHSFLIAYASDLQLFIRNERDENGLLKDLLIVSASYGSVSIFLTALASANLYDIYNTCTRMRIENKKSYVQTLKESNPESSGAIRYPKDELTTPLRLRTNFTAEVGSFKLHVFPSTLFDSEVLILKANKMNVVAATQTEQKTKTDLTWQIRDINISLAPFKNELTEEKFNELTVEKYIEKTAQLEGDIILAAPSVFVGITTWQKIPETEIELLYSSSFGDKVDIKWNLDPINFAREMWATHVRALSVRRGHLESSPSKPFFEDENIAEKIKIVNLGTKYKYIPLEEPHIEMPLLRDLGSATPPIEWFGVNRRRFPGMAHQLVVIPLQKFIYVAEDRYNKVLGENLGAM